MKKHRSSQVILLGLSFLAFAAPAGAASRAKGAPPTAPSPAPESSGGSEAGYSGPWGLGVQTFESFGGSSTALSGWFEVGPKGVVQPVFTIGGTSPFEFGVGAFYRQTVAGSMREGLHLGGGLGIGSVHPGGGADGKFFFNAALLAGLHFQFPGLSHVMVNLDAAATFVTVNSNSNFSVGGLSPALGLGVHYLF